VAGYRVYGLDDVARLGFITRSRALGFSIAEIRELVSLEENPALSCGEVDELARRHRDQVRTKLAQLRRLDEALSELITGCRGGQRADCAILHALQRPDAAAKSRS
jgi:MerR family mercuric resistance operon transcriptional regulator